MGCGLFSLNFFLIDFSLSLSGANFGMHWHHRARPEAPADAHVHRQEDPPLLLCGSCSSVPLHSSETVCLSKFMCIFHCFLFSSSHFSFPFLSVFFLFVISFENVRLVIQQIPFASLPAAPPRHLHLHMYLLLIPFVVFHVIPLAIRHFSTLPA